MFDSLDISTSALVAQRIRLDAIAGNIANAQATRRADGQPGAFQRRLAESSRHKSNKVMRVLRLLLQHAVDEGHLETNPATRLKLRTIPPRRQVWSSGDIEAFCASAERLRFSFTPYNAQQVTSEFVVQGFDKLAGLVGNTCGWKLEESRPQPDRNARLNQTKRAG